MNYYVDYEDSLLMIDEDLLLMIDEDLL